MLGSRASTNRTLQFVLFTLTKQNNFGAKICTLLALCLTPYPLQGVRCRGRKQSFVIAAFYKYKSSYKSLICTCG